MIISYNDGYFAVRTGDRLHTRLDANQVIGHLAPYQGKVVRYLCPGERPEIVATGVMEEWLGSDYFNDEIYTVEHPPTPRQVVREVAINEVRLSNEAQAAMAFDPDAGLGWDWPSRVGATVGVIGLITLATLYLHLL